MLIFVNQKIFIVFCLLKLSKSQSLNQFHPETWPSWWCACMGGLSLTFIRFKQYLILIGFIFSWPLFNLLRLTRVIYSFQDFNTIWGFFACRYFPFAQGNNRQGCKHCFKESVCWFTYFKSIKIKGNENLIHMACRR